MRPIGQFTTFTPDTYREPTATVGVAVERGLTELNEVGWVVREVGVHLADELVAFLEAVFEAGDVCCAEAEFSGPFDKVYSTGVSVDFFSYDFRGSVWRVVVDDEDVEWLREGHYGINDSCRVLTFVVHRDDDAGIGSVWCSCHSSIE